MAAAPGHTLYVGEFAALEARFLEEVGSLKRGDALRPVDVLVGSNLLGVYLRRRAAESLGGIANVRFLTFVDLARERLDEPDPRPSLPPLGDALLARRTLRENAAGAAFRELRERPSVAALLVRTADDLREAGIGADRLSGHFPAVAATPDRARLLGDVATLVADFEERRARFADPTAALERASTRPGRPSAEPLLVYGLYDLGGLRERLLAAVARERPVLAFVPDDGEDDDLGPGSPPVRGRLFEALLGVRPARLAGPPAASPAFVVTPTVGAEARETVRELLRATDDGIPLHACAVLLRDPARQEPALLAELRRREIPFFRPAGGGFSRSPLGRALRSLVSLASGGFAASDAVDLADALEGASVLEAGSAARLARFFGELRFRGGLDDLRHRCAETRRRRAVTESPDSEAEGRLSTRSRRLHESLETADAFLALAGPALLSASPTSFLEWAGRLSASVSKLFPSNPDRTALESALESIGSLDALEPWGIVSADEVLALIPEALEAVPVRTGRFERDGIAILSAVSARGLLFDAVFVPGLAEQLFPKPGRPDPLLFDEERRALAVRAGAPLAPRTGQRHAREERFLFHLARTSARRRLVLLAARREATTDRPRLLSPFLLDEIAAASGQKVREKDLSSPRAVAGLRWLPLGVVPEAEPPTDGSEALSRALARSPGLAARLPSPPDGLARALARAAGRSSDAFTDREGRIGRSSPRLSLTRRPLSASFLERRAACAYRSFLADGLGLEAPDAPPDALYLDALALGTLAHSTLERLAGAAGPRGLVVLDVRSIRSAVRAEVEALFRELEVDPPPALLGAAESLVLARVEAVVERERARSVHLPVAGAEVRFGPREAIAPRVALPSGEASLVGRIDRLDRDAEAALVVDYKFGKARPYGKKNARQYRIAGGERLQLAVYALAARALGAARPRAEYLFVDREEDASVPVPIGFDERGTEEAVDLFVAAAGLLDDAASRGHFFPKTAPFASRESHCGRCEFDSVCGPGHRRVYDRKRSAEREREPESPLFALEELH